MRWLNLLFDSKTSLDSEDAEISDPVVRSARPGMYCMSKQCNIYDYNVQLHIRVGLQVYIDGREN